MDIQKALYNRAKDRSRSETHNVNGVTLYEDGISNCKRFTLHAPELRSFVDFADRKDDNEAGSVNAGHRDRSSSEVAFPKYKDLTTAWNRGWDEGVQQIKQKRIEMGLDHTSGRLTQEYDVYGNAIDIGRVVQGHPESWFRDEIVEDGHGGGIKKIIVHTSNHSDMTSESIIRKGVVVCALIDVLESAGYRCELTAVFGSAQKQGSVYTGFVTIKRAQDPLNYDKIALAFIAPDFNRRWKFSSQHKWCEGSFPSHVNVFTYGSPVSMLDLEQDYYYDFDQFDVKIDYDVHVNTTYGTDKRAISEFKNMVAEQGIELDETANA